MPPETYRKLRRKECEIIRWLLSEVSTTSITACSKYHLVLMKISFPSVHLSLYLRTNAPRFAHVNVVVQTTASGTRVIQGVPRFYQRIPQRER